MAGLLDYLGGDDSQAGAMDPRLMGLLGMAQGFGSQLAPQPASRLPLARPNMAYGLSQAAGGYGAGYGKGLEQQQLQAATQGQQLKNLNDTLQYNFWAPWAGAKPLPMPGIPSGAPQMAAGAQPGAGGMVRPSAGLAPGQPGVAAPAAGAGFGGSAPAGGPDIATMMRTMPPPVLQHFGISVPPELNLLYAAGIGPGDPRYQNALDKVVVKGMGVNPVIGGERPGVPAQNFNMATNRYEPQPGTFDTMAQGAYTQAHAAGMGGLGPKEAEAAFKAGLDVRTANTNARNTAFYQTGNMPPDAMNPTGSPAVGVGPNGDIATKEGNVVPAIPTKGAYPGTDAIINQNANTKLAEQNFGSVQTSLQQSEGRLMATAKALQMLQSTGGLTQHRAEIASALRGAGLGPAADIVMSAKDQAAVETALGHQTWDVLQGLKAIATGTGSRILNSEFVHTLDSQAGPDLLPEANFNLISTMLGGINQTKRMIGNYYGIAKPMQWGNGWGLDANSFMSAYYDKPQNSMQRSIEDAGQALGSMRGGAWPTPPAAAIKALQMDKSRAGDFTAKYGPASARTVLGQ